MTTVELSIPSKIEIEMATPAKLDASLSSAETMAVNLISPQSMEATVEKNNVITVGAEPQVFGLSFDVAMITSTYIPPLTEQDKELLNFFADGNNKANCVLRDLGGRTCERIDLAGIGKYMFVFSNLNGVGDNKVITFIWNGTNISYFLDYQLASMPSGTTGDVLTSGNINNYITIPSGTILTADNWTNYISVPSSNEWIWADCYDSNWYNAKEIFVYYHGTDDKWYCGYFYIPDMLGTYPYRCYMVDASKNFFFYYNGSYLELHDDDDNSVTTDNVAYYKL